MSDMFNLDRLHALDYHDVNCQKEKEFLSLHNLDFPILSIVK